MNRKFGRIERQLHGMFKSTGVLNFGESKHEATVQARESLKAEGLPSGPHEIAKETGFYSQGSYKNAFHTLSNFAQFLDSSKVKSIEDFGRRSVEKFLNEQVEKGISRDHYGNIESHLTKFEGMLERHFENKGIEKDLGFIDKAKDFCRPYANEHLENKVISRSYEDPRAIIDNLNREDHRLVASVQLEAGGRINEAALIDDKRLGGIIEREDKDVGVIHLQRGDAKGGLARDLYLPKETYQAIEKYVAENGKLHIERGHDRDEYRAAIKLAAEVTGQDYTGSHGLRHNFAQERMAELESQGVGHRIALTQVSVEMGHFREDITKHYLRT